MTLSEVEVKDLIKSVSLAVEDEDKLMTKLNNILQDKLAEKEEKAKENAAKPKFIPFGMVDLDTVSDTTKDGMGYIMMFPDGMEMGDIPARITDAIRIFNESKKGRKAPVHNVEEACAYIPNKVWKQVGLKVKTKDKTYFQSVQNVTIPQTEA